MANPTDEANGVNWFRLWTPPPDPDKPPCPYQPGFSVDIRAHVPPPPFGHHRYGPNPRPCVPDGFLKTTTQSALVMAYPPLEGPGPLSSSATASLTARLTILEPLAVADGRGAQLVVCTVSTVSDDSDNKKPFEAVAKIFDPLYYSLADNFVPSVPADVTRQADSDYSCEAAAYEHLQTVRAGGEADRFSPAYHGSWTFSLPITIQRDENGDENESKTLQRSVRLVLVERIAGPSVRNLCLAPDGPPYDSAYRLEILARILDGAVRQVHAGLEQRDLAARNVILADDDDNDDDEYDDNKVQQKYPRPVLVDYNISLVTKRTAQRSIPLQLEALPPNPMRYFWGSPLWAEFEGWTPSEWDAGDSMLMMREWLARRFGDEKVAQAYAPVRDELKVSA